jgi:hypothetical protein
MNYELTGSGIENLVVPHRIIKGDKNYETCMGRLFDRS